MSFGKRTFRGRAILVPALGIGLLGFGGAGRAHAQSATIPESGSGISVRVDPTNGGYSVHTRGSDWTFEGTTGAPLSHVTLRRDSDTLGKYQELNFNWQGADGPLSGAIRTYDDRPAVLFSVSTPKAIAHWTTEFPAFTKFPQGLHPFSYQDSVFSPHTFHLAQNSTPYLLFDDNAHAAVLSPASNYFVAKMSGDGATAINSGLNLKNTGVPAHFAYRTLLVFGDGIRTTFSDWGHTLTDLEGRKRPGNDADTMLKYFGYWTDNGAYYYYNYDLDKGYAGTMTALVDYYRQKQIPLRYLQLDSWWYEKTRTSPEGRTGGPKNSRLPEGTWNAYGGTLTYRASPDLFPQGLAAFQKTVNVPLVVHGRWIDPESPYHKNYKISGIAPVDPKWWDETARYLKDSGVICYEQDWLNEIYFRSPEIGAKPGVGEAFADSMAHSANKNGETVQYCMTLPRYVLNGARYDNLTTTRVSDDRFTRGKWNHFLYTSALADAMGIWPWVDVFMSPETDNMLLATLSAGPVGTGDAMGKESKENILKAARADGRIVKPDAPILPSDASFLADAREQHTPLVSWTYTDHPLRTAYVFAFARKDDTGTPSFTPASLGIKTPAYVYDYFAGTGKRVEAADTFSGDLGATGRAYYIVAPIGPSGIAFLGDRDKFVGMGRQRIPDLKDEPGKLTATVALSPEESSVTLQGYASAAPTATTPDGVAQPVQYDPATQRFTVTVAPSQNAATTPLQGDPVHLVTVVLTPGRS